MRSICHRQCICRKIRWLKRGPAAGPSLASACIPSLGPRNISAVPSIVYLLNPPHDLGSERKASLFLSPLPWPVEQLAAETFGPRRRQPDSYKLHSFNSVSSVATSFLLDINSRS